MFKLRFDWYISRRFVLIQDDGDRSRKDFWVHFGTLERTQVFTGTCGIRFIVIQINTWINWGHGYFKKANALILRCWWLFVSLLCKNNLSECCWYNLWNVMAKIALKINCWDSNPPVLAENLPFLENTSGLPFPLNILLVFETLPSQRKIMFSLFHQYQTFFAFFVCLGNGSWISAEGGGVLPYNGYIGMCRCEGYGCQAVFSCIRYINHSVWV